MGKLQAVLVSVLVSALASCVTQTTNSSQVGENLIPSVGNSISKKNVNSVEAARNRLQLAMRYLEKGVTDKAKENLEKAESLANLPEVYYYFGYFYQTVDEPELAETYYKKAINNDSSNADAQNFYGAFLCGRKRYDEADKAFMAAVTIPSYTKAAETYENAAICALANGKTDQAELYFGKALSHDSRRIVAVYELAKLYKSKKDCAKALKMLQKLRLEAGDTPQGLLLSAQCQQEMGDDLRASTNREYLKSRFPNSAEARSLTETK